MNTSKNIIKSTLLATCIFWLIILSKGFEAIMIPLIFLSIIPISISCAITILLTILPFFWLKNKETTNRKVFETYFPFYTIVLFSLCLYFSIKEPIFISFFASAFFVAMQSWVWFGEEIETK